MKTSLNQPKLRFPEHLALGLKRLGFLAHLDLVLLWAVEWVVLWVLAVVA
jgi:hypothetical protein